MAWRDYDCVALRLFEVICYVNLNLLLWYDPLSLILLKGNNEAVRGYVNVTLWCGFDVILNDIWRHIDVVLLLLLCHVDVTMMLLHAIITICWCVVLVLVWCWFDYTLRLRWCYVCVMLMLWWYYSSAMLMQYCGCLNIELISLWRHTDIIFWVASMLRCGYADITTLCVCHRLCDLDAIPMLVWGFDDADLSLVYVVFTPRLCYAEVILVLVLCWFGAIFRLMRYVHGIMRLLWGHVAAILCYVIALLSVCCHASVILTLCS